MKAPLFFLSAMVALAVPSLSVAQQLNQPHERRPFQAISSSDSKSSSGNNLPAPKARQRSGVRSDASQRDPVAQVASDTGIKTQRPKQPASTQPQAIPKPVRVTDSHGQIMNGAVQVAPNRVMDPKTGHIYSTVPTGDGQRTLEALKK